MIAVRGFARIGLIIILLKGPYGLPTTFPPLPFLKSTCQHFYLPVFFAAPTLNHNDQTYDSASGEVEGIIISPLSPKFPKCRVFTSANLTLLFFHPYIILNNVKENVVITKSHYCVSLTRLHYTRMTLIGSSRACASCQRFNFYPKSIWSLSPLTNIFVLSGPQTMFIK